MINILMPGVITIVGLEIAILILVLLGLYLWDGVNL
jgi:hypothetical protein